jgi:hypothetical protein
MNPGGTMYHNHRQERCGQPLKVPSAGRVPPPTQGWSLHAAGGRHRCDVEPVSAETQPVSARSRAKISDIENLSSRDRPRKFRPSARDVRYSSSETGLLAANLRKCRYFLEYQKFLARDPFGWLTTQSVSDRSGGQIPCQQGILQGISPIWGLTWWLSRLFDRQLQRLTLGIPYSTKQGIIAPSREFFRASREF